ncbi:hypothetical protein A2526_00925 [candidate division WOR-1 bacterium RIFOXYD2_FULL_36_8]|uniref:SIMPL domain-containing protein n=1 Tax=candidate division WOR-1 bacterium RIFOXYB2_FULL_36_35 TaxID=1802578 RepID=A0A1F4S6C3_UNCSA|nr:MAG: hypothetical protein A2230_01425 [candidate division WOR-1 bacterium RIFOXYA2_FULL_36_21]OGC14364.1 MAG: hypothetical protein A2282_07930 [candidate division WOR-1 bacterium RIFOXYA12_FULL_36_13]OGC15960.1 MAG: hypothetical protein A2290_06895 [candidate division WOR-1 bacterium RIFOXYB2_FULL_36_35]OGC37373.1 MAG: hypothetical protein A2526_00925 [candidate division WOR-1 bacterium RIFOXYD2_FULL_36_8]
MKIVKSFLVFLFVSLFLSPCFANSQTLIVTGVGNVNVEPDTATITLGVQTDEKTASKAQSKNAEIMQKVIDSIKSFNIPKDKIKTSRFSIGPKMKYESGSSYLIGYTCNNQVSVTISDDLKKVSKIIDKGTSAGANQVLSVNFSRKDILPYRKEALKLAVESAKSKARAIADAAGLTLVRIEKIEGQEINNWGIISPQTNISVERAFGGESATPIYGGDINVTMSVNVTYVVK